jgi:hypothetical protein
MGNQGSPLPPPFYNLFEKKQIILFLLFEYFFATIKCHFL